MDATYIVKRPLLTEKATRLSELHQYVFEVDRLARKDEIKAAVEQIYRVRVESVNTSNRKARNRKTRWGLTEGKTTKKAIVRLHEGDAIELF